MRAIKAHYLRLYRAADEILNQPNNPCEIRVEDGKPTCTYSRRASPDDPYHSYYTTASLCCRDCKYLGPTGCTVEALGCKLEWCLGCKYSITGMKYEDHPMFAQIAALREEANGLLGTLLDVRETYEDIVWKIAEHEERLGMCRIVGE